MNKVSVIITTYNSENYIENTLDTIFNQKGAGIDFELEVLVVDDCSIDNTTDILRRKKINFLVTNKNTGGPNRGRNMGLQAAKGDFICITDHDDLWNENKIITLLPYFEKVPIVTSGYTFIDNLRNKVIKRVSYSKNKFIYYNENETFLAKLAKSQNGQNCYLGSIMFKEELKNILFEEHFGMLDFDWCLRLFYKNPSIEVCESLYTRTVLNSNLSLNPSYRQKDFYYSLMVIENYEKQFPKQVRQAYHKIHGNRARYYYLTGNMKKARFYFLKSGFNFKTLFYYLTTFIGSGLVKKYFNIFG